MTDADISEVLEALKPTLDGSLRDRLAAERGGHHAENPEPDRPAAVNERARKRPGIEQLQVEMQGLGKLFAVFGIEQPTGNLERLAFLWG